MRTNTTVIAVGILCVLTWSVSAHAATIHVPADQSTIQAGIDAAVDGDTVLVASGTYTGVGNRDINFNGKGVVLKSETGSDSTIIDCQDSTRAFVIHSNEDSTTVIEGFNIRNGFDFFEGGAMYIADASPTVRQCVFASNTAYPFEQHGQAGYGNGGAIYCIRSAPQFIDCYFIHSSANYGTASDVSMGGAIYAIESSIILKQCDFFENFAIDGAGLSCRNSSLSVEGCTFRENLSPTSSGGGVSITTSNCSFLYTAFIGNRAGSGGAVSSVASHSWYSYCSFLGNRGGFGGAISQGWSSTTSLSNCTFAFNTSPRMGSSVTLWRESSLLMSNCILAFGAEGPAVVCFDSCCSVNVSCTNVFGNAEGDWVGCISGQDSVNNNLSADPLFCDTSLNDLHLDPDSPCAPTNNTCGVLIGALGVGCSGALPVIDPDTMSAYQAFNIDSLIATIHFGDFSEGHTVDDIDLSTLLINGSFQPDSWSILQWYPGFADQVMRLNILLSTFILSYGPLFDVSTQTYTISGQFSDSSPFAVTGQFTMIGHLSGDINIDGSIDVADLTYLVEFLFGGGPSPRLFQTADLDGSGTVDISDLSALVEYLFP